MASLSTSFSTLALSRSSNNKPYRKNPNSKIISKPKSKSNSKSKSLDEKLSATTYMRLPPKDDLLSLSLSETYREIKLSDSSAVVLKQLNGSNYEDYEVRDVEEYEEDDDGETMVFRGEEFEDEKDKEKGVPAVMRCFDKAKIFVKAGNGGNGVMAFRREKFVPLGGPSGGDGGRGGNVYVEVDGAMNSLLPFRNCLHFRAGRGGHGHGRNQHGARGQDVVVKVAPGTVIREVRDDGIEGQVLLELLHPGQRALLLPGGRGGRGNAAFKSGVNKVPKIAENGEEGPEM